MQRTIEQELILNGHSFFQTVGDSMEPLLHNRRSTVVIEKRKNPLKRYDVVLYRRPTGEYVLHRIVKVLQGKYLICGDNRLWRENVPDEWIIGVMIGFYKNEQNHYISCDSKDYRKYLKTLKCRYGIRWLCNLPVRVRRKLFHKQ